MAQEYKVNGLSKLDLKSGEKREVEVDGIEGGKVLLVKVGDKTHALGPKCTHYGAPLKNGVLTPDGRLTCPWHGGQFNISWFSKWMDGANRAPKLASTSPRGMLRMHPPLTLWPNSK